MFVSLSINFAGSKVLYCPCRILCKSRCRRSGNFLCCCSELQCSRLAVCCAVSLDTYCDEGVLSLRFEASYGYSSLCVLLEGYVALCENIRDSLVYVRLCRSESVPCIFCCTIMLNCNLSLVGLNLIYCESECEVLSVRRSLRSRICAWAWLWTGAGSLPQLAIIATIAATAANLKNFFILYFVLVCYFQSELNFKIKH